MENKQLVENAINTIRFLSTDAINKANSGHPGLPMGTATIAYTIWKKHMNHNPNNPNWINRDRFILSGGHGSMLIYSLLYLSGYGLTLDDIKDFRQLGSKTPGHPEYGHTKGVEVTTGPLGQGFATGVGMALAERFLAGRFNQNDAKIIDHYIYGIVTDGDLMEGVSSEAASLAGHQKLGKLIYFYDDNKISIDGSTDLAFTEDRGMRFEAYGWHVQYVDDGNDIDALDQAIENAKKDERPSIIICKTTIGFGLPTKQGTSKAHGEPPGIEEVKEAKKNMGWDPEKDFYVDDEVLDFWRELQTRGDDLEEEWTKKYQDYKNSFPEYGKEFDRILEGKLPENWDAAIEYFPADEKGIASRASSGKALNMIAKNLPDIIQGSADLHPSNKTWINGSEAATNDNPAGRNIHYGVREHAMGAAANGLALYPGVISACSTFFVFSDYLRPVIRVSALSNYPTIWVFTHDSIGVGEDGPTHQPVEHLASLRCIPNLVTIRPADANETIEAWKIAIQRSNGPTALVLSRQNLPTLDRDKYASVDNVKKGAYVLADLGDKEPEMILLATGSEVDLIVKAANILVEKGKSVRIVSMPSWELFNQQSDEYKESVLPTKLTKRLAVEAGVSFGWKQWIGDHGKTITLDRFGESGPASKVFEKFGFTVENVVEKALSL